MPRQTSADPDQRPARPVSARPGARTGGSWYHLRMMGFPQRAALLALLACVSGVTVGCATSTPVRPLGRGRSTLNIDVGGPLVKALGTKLATPILTIGGAYGLSDRYEATARIDATAAAYGVLHVEPGVAYHPLVRDAGWVPTVTLAGSVHLLTDFQATRVAPLATATAAWTVASRHVVYAGANLATVFGSPTRIIVGPLVGGEFRVGNAGLALEAKWLAPYYDVGPTAPTWLSPGDRGFLSLLLGFHYYFEEGAR